MADDRIPGLSRADMAALAAIAAANMATNQALAELTRAHGVTIAEPAPQPQPHQQKRLRRFRVSRDENGYLVGEELDPVGTTMPAPAAPEPNGFADVFGSIEEL
jgi:hypothetical protein